MLPPPSKRQQRVRELIKRALGEILRREMDTATCGLVTINEVGLAKDLQSATIYVGILGTAQQRQEGAARLQQQRGRIQYQLGQEIQLRYTPVVSFRLDDSIERGNRVLEIIDGLEDSPA